MDFVNFKDHLQELLDSISADTFEVSSVRNMDGKTKKVQVVFTPLTGSVYKNSASIPYQIDIYAKKPDEIINIFTALSKQRNGKSFISMVETEEGVKEYTIFEFYSTPGVSEKQLDYGSNTVAHLVLFASLNVLFEVGNVSSIKIDGEELEIINGSLNYVVEVYSKRISGKPQNAALKTASTTNLTFTLINKTNVFTTALFNLAVGVLKSKVFNVTVSLTNGLTATIPMIVTQNAFSFAFNSANLPSLNVTMSLTEPKEE